MQIEFVTSATPAPEGTALVVLRNDATDGEPVDLLRADGRRVRYAEVKEAPGDAVAAAVRTLPGAVRVELGATPPQEAAAIASSLRLGLYRFDRYRTRAKKAPSPTQVTVACDDADRARALFEERAALIDSVLFVRDLVSEPPNVLHPVAFAARMQELAPLGVAVEVLDETALREAGMGALLAVGQGSRAGSRLVILRWNGGATDTPPVLLVGKGVCFDSGGLSIKASENMDQMKWDMGGAAAVAGAVRALAASKARVNVVGLLGLVENMPDGAAYRPGDVLTSMSGQTIEVLNTDAEGRLVLADAVTYGQRRFQPRVVVDIATLTSAVEQALGKDMAGYVANDDDVARRLEAAGAASGDRVWRLPFVEAYHALLDSDVADMKNITERGVGAGSIVGALFVHRFVEPGVAWAHVDIAGVAWRKQSRWGSIPPGATGFGAALLAEFVRSYEA